MDWLIVLLFIGGWTYLWTGCFIVDWWMDLLMDLLFYCLLVDGLTDGLVALLLIGGWTY